MDFNEALQVFLQKYLERVTVYYQKDLPNLTIPTISTEETQKYIKVIALEPYKRLICFIAKEDFSNKTLGNMEKGGIYKSANSKVPAKHKRGSIFSEQNGMEAITYHGGIVYLK